MTNIFCVKQRSVNRMHHTDAAILMYVVVLKYMNHMKVMEGKNLQAIP